MAAPSRRCFSGSTVRTSTFWTPARRHFVMFFISYSSVLVTETSQAMLTPSRSIYRSTVSCESGSCRSMVARKPRASASRLNSAWAARWMSPPRPNSSRSAFSVVVPYCGCSAWVSAATSTGSSFAGIGGVGMAGGSAGSVAGVAGGSAIFFPLLGIVSAKSARRLRSAASISLRATA